MTWRRLLPGDDLACAGVRPVDVDLPGGDRRELVAWRDAAGRPCVMAGRCPHQWSHLGTEGWVDGDELVCEAHFWRFDREGHGSKRSMRGRRDPKSDVAVFPCREVDGWLEADLDVPDEAVVRADGLPPATAP